MTSFLNDLGAAMIASCAMALDQAGSRRRFRWPILLQEKAELPNHCHAGRPASASFSYSQGRVRFNHREQVHPPYDPSLSARNRLPRVRFCLRSNHSWRALTCFIGARSILPAELYHRYMSGWTSVSLPQSRIREKPSSRPASIAKPCLWLEFITSTRPATDTSRLMEEFNLIGVEDIERCHPWC